MFKRVAFLAVFVVLAGSPAAAATPFAICDDLRASTPAEEAIAACTAALEGNLSKKNRAQTLLNRGNWRTALDKASDAALEDFTKALEVDPSRWTPYLFRAQIHVEAARFDEALVEIAKFMKRDKGDTLAWIVSGRANLGAGNTEKAVADLTRALKLDSDGADILFYRGTAHQKAGATAKALADWDKALKIDSELLPVYIKRSALLFDMGMHERVIADVDMIMDLSKNIDTRLAARLLRAKSYAALDDVYRAIKELDELREIAPDFAEANAFYDEYEKRMIAEGQLKPKS